MVGVDLGSNPSVCRLHVSILEEEPNPGINVIQHFKWLWIQVSAEQLNSNTQLPLVCNMHCITYGSNGDSQVKCFISVIVTVALA